MDQNLHFVLAVDMNPPYPDHLKQVRFGMGCFWGVERLFWQQKGIHVTSVGYGGGGDGGGMPNPSYEQVCTGKTNHAELVRVVYDPEQIDFQALLRLFWEQHDPTQGNRQGNDVGSQYRSAIYVDEARQLAMAQQSKAQYQQALYAAGGSVITTEIKLESEYYPAEPYHQQYLAKKPDGYCNLHGTGIIYPKD
ncbi:MAG: peptide-methionine (S)-S-oxide reductase MsrA [Alphaproteobacteria bacterium]